MKHDLRRVTSPGKFEGSLVIDQYLWEVSHLDCDDCAGSVEDMGWHGLMRAGCGLAAFVEPERESELTESEKDFLLEQSGAIVREDSQGFVHVEWFEDRDKLDSAWQEIEEAETALLEEEV